jgi:hypothetical protein
MNPTLRNVLAVLAGAVICMVLNGLLLQLMMQLIPPPAGFDPNNLATYTLLEGMNFLGPFVAHAFPSLIGAFLAARMGASHRMTLALIVGGLHMLGGIAAAVMIPAPTWFIVVDLSLAYLPMAWVGGRLANAAWRKE